jgi:hypothetical protein
MLDQHIQDITDRDMTRFVATRVLGWVDSDPAGIASLGRVAVNPRTTGTLLKFSALALASIHTVDTLRWFDQLLNRRERDAQQMAISGLVQFINGYPIRTPESFKDMSFMKPSSTPYSSDLSWKSHVPQDGASDADFNAAAAYWKAWLRMQKLVQ